MSKRRFAPVTPAIAAELGAICGAAQVIFGDPDRLEPYAHDQVMEKEYAHLPEVVVRPGNTAEVAAVMRLANRERIPVTPRGAGSGLSGGAVPLHGGILLSLDRMNRIIEMDVANLTAVVEPGVVTNEINERAKEHELFYAGYPMSVESCFIGGNVAENAGGGRAVKYGVTDRYIIGLEVVTPTGEIITLGGKRMKDVVGYNLLKLMVGSEGTLGIFTKIFLRLMPLPRHKVDLLAFFPDIDAALMLVPEILARTGITPASIEFMDRDSIQSACRFLNEELPYERAEGSLLIELDGNSPAALEEEYLRIGELCQAHGATEVYVADNATTSERIWRIRRNIGESLLSFSSLKSSEDIVVPPAAIAPFMAAVKRTGARHAVLIPCFGHAGDGNIHTTIVKPADMPVDRWKEVVVQVQSELYRAALDLGGTISGEHGIGHKKKRFMGQALDPETLRLMKGIQELFDPNGILNPGKIFP